jgi:hypothetical protein
MWVKSGALIAVALVSGSLWMSNDDAAIELVGQPVKVNDRSTISTRQDSVPAVLLAFKTGDRISGVVENDPFIGTWSGDCGDQVQCDLEIERSGESYSLVLKVAEWQKADKVLCRLSGKMHIGRGGQMLAGPMGSSPLSGVFVRGAGAIELHDAPDGDCNEANTLDGVYRILGD